MINQQFTVPPLSRKKIRNVAHRLRDLCQTDKTKFIDVIKLLETGVLKFISADFEWDITDREELPLEHGLTDFTGKIVKIREDVYEGAIAGRGRDRLTVMHEIAHALLHEKSSLARLAPNSPRPEPFRCPEWQANCFGGEFLVDVRKIDAKTTVDQAAKEFGVSKLAAKKQLDAYVKDGLLDRKTYWYIPKTNVSKSGCNHFLTQK